MKSIYKNYYFFKEPTKFDEDHLMVCDGIGHIFSSSFLIDRDYFFNNLVMFVISGKLYVEQFSKTYTLTENQGVLMKLTNKHKYYSDKNDPPNILWFHFRGKNCEYFLDKLSDLDLLPLIFSSETIENNIYKLFDVTMKKDFAYELDISSIIYSSIIEIVKDKFGELQKKSASPQDIFMSKVDNYLDSNIYNNISLDEFSKYMNMSKYHFCRIFKTHFNTTPIKYVLFKKIEFSKNLLNYTNDKIETIASRLGFVDASHFSKSFKLIVGISPIIYRKRRVYS